MSSHNILTAISFVLLLFVMSPSPKKNQTQTFTDNGCLLYIIEFKAKCDKPGNVLLVNDVIPRSKDQNNPKTNKDKWKY